MPMRECSWHADGRWALRARLRVRRIVVRISLLLGLAAVVAMVLVGCSDPIRRYETLSIFFDGVPMPPELAPTTADGGRETAPGKKARPDSQETHEVVFRYHEPYVKRDCFACHDERQGYEATLHGVDSCRKCHQSYFELSPNDWMHGPVAMQECRRCHESHRSEFDGLLTKPQVALCQECHDAKWVARDPYHGRLEDRTCSRCHDPHSAGNRLLLIDARTIERRRKVRREGGSAHTLYEQDACAQCHVVEESNRLKQNVDAVCISCHKAALASEGAPLHKAVTDGHCLSCHTSHRSPRPNLIRPTAEQTCFQCHKREEIETLKHPNVTRVDCLACHTGHHQQRDHMLRDGVGVPAPSADSITASATQTNNVELGRETPP